MSGRPLPRHRPRMIRTRRPAPEGPQPAPCPRMSHSAIIAGRHRGRGACVPDTHRSTQGGVRAARVTTRGRGACVSLCVTSVPHIRACMRCRTAADAALRGFFSDGVASMRRTRNLGDALCALAVKEATPGPGRSRWFRVARTSERTSSAGTLARGSDFPGTDPTGGIYCCTGWTLARIPYGIRKVLTCSCVRHLEGLWKGCRRTMHHRLRSIEASPTQEAT